MRQMLVKARRHGAQGVQGSGLAWIAAWRASTWRDYLDIVTGMRDEMRLRASA